MQKLSTSKLANKLNIPSSQLFQILQNAGLIIKEENIWKLTQKGKENSGTVLKSKRFGYYIAWDSDFDPYKKFQIQDEKYITATQLAQYFNTSSRKINIVIGELGLIAKTIKGWGLTHIGKSLGGIEVTHSSGRIFVKWPEKIKKHKLLIQEFHTNTQSEISGEMQDFSHKTNDILDDFRSKFPAQYRTKDGHNVRSRGEVIIDNMLYEYGLAHAYERKLPIDEVVYCDFYIPARLSTSAVYIEYWGKEDEKYLSRKKEKQEIYKKYNLNLIELENYHIDNLDDYLPKLLLDFGIKVD